MMLSFLIAKSFTAQIAERWHVRMSANPADRPVFMKDLGDLSSAKDIQNAFEAAKWQKEGISFDAFQEEALEKGNRKNLLAEYAKFRNAVRRNNLDVTAEEMQKFLDDKQMSIDALQKKNEELSKILKHISNPYIYKEKRDTNLLTGRRLLPDRVDFSLFSKEIERADLDAADKLLDKWDPIKAAFDDDYKKEYQKLKDRIDILRWQKRFFQDDRVAYMYFQGTEVKKICFLLQGLGDTAQRFAHSAPKVDNVLYIVPQAFEKWTVVYPYTFNRSWFRLGRWGLLSIIFPDHGMVLEGTKRGADELSMWIKSVMYAHNLEYKDVFVAGFSQGAILAARLMEQDINLKRAIIVAGGSPDEGFVPFEGEDVDSERYLVINWKDDPLMPDELVQKYLKRLKKVYANVEEKQVSDCQFHPEVIGCDEAQEIMKNWIGKNVFTR